ncbi:MAG TPA: alpha/beta hydrolase, partial [Terriglobales bacterium]|nr:alpha/beta hydrolase [Terriglobales bacterium]
LADRRALCRYLWHTWSPTWQFSDATYDRTASSFDNPDFVDVVIHSYRHRHRNAPGDPRFDEVEKRLGGRPPITVPTVILHGGDDAVGLREPEAQELFQFRPGTPRHVVPGVGHFMPRERPEALVDALRAVLR